MICLPKFNAEEILELSPVSTVMMGVPTVYTRLLQEAGLTRGACARMRLFVSGSAPLLADTHREWRARTGHAILERYGMTETNMNASNPYRGDRVPGSVGPAIEGVEIRVVDENTAVPVAEGDIGMIEIRGPNVFKGYWRMPEKTASEFRPDGFFITGDLGRIDQQGYLTIVGRSKDLIITGGYNVYPKEVEIEIDALESVLESAVVGIPDADFGEAVTAFVVLKPEKSLTQQEVLLSLRARLASFKLPKSVVFLISCHGTRWARFRRTCFATWPLGRHEWRPRQGRVGLKRALMSVRIVALEALGPALNRCPPGQVGPELMALNAVTLL